MIQRLLCIVGILFITRLLGTTAGACPLLTAGTLLWCNMPLPPLRPFCTASVLPLHAVLLCTAFAVKQYRLCTRLARQWSPSALYTANLQMMVAGDLFS